MSRKIILIFLSIILASAVAEAIAWRQKQNSSPPPSAQSANPLNSLSVSPRTRCLADDEYADYPINNRYPEWQKAAQVPVVISVHDKATAKVKSSFVVENVPPDESEQLELHRCGVYILREFQQGINWSRELWRYDYQGNGSKLLVLLQTKNDEIIKTGPQFYAVFMIDPAETYLALDRVLSGSSNESTVVKSLSSPNLSDVLTLTGEDILRAAPSLSKNRDAEAMGWSSDGSYLWGVSSNADFSGTVYFRVDIQNTNKIEIFPMPDDAVHLNKPNFDSGYIFYVYGPPFTGIPEVTQQISNEWKQAGKKEELFLYNLFTTKKTLIASSDNPYWNFQGHWISANQFQYTQSSGATTTYTISQ